ncbi:hypothetical protein [Paludisphaera rhizosphaerae]|uniref:hypothetical protein n=1 Tax=Paludisphaera rhizosphaerae TaxID=2711216 RepID=UPI0013ECC737|nr:hypothetical protein [Paludisphaera rhizosphaerae]
MTRDPNGMRDRLLKAERITPDLKRRYDLEIQAMIEKKLTKWQRWGWLASAIFGTACAVVFGALAVVGPGGLPWAGRLGLAGGAVFGLAWAWLGLRVFRRGVLDLKLDTGLAAGLSWCLPIFLTTLFMVAAPDDVRGLRMILCGLVFLVAGAMFLTRHVVEQSELKTREKLLEIEYRLAELTEVVKADAGGQGA